MTAKAAWASPQGVATATDGTLFMARARGLMVDERVVVPAPAADVEPSVVKLVYLVEKRPELTDEAFVQHWTTVHADLAQQMPGLLGYSINSPSAEQRGPRPLDGYAVLHFASRDLAKAAWDSPAGVATAQDGTIFMANARPLIVDELEVLKLNVDSNKR